MKMIFSVVFLSIVFSNDVDSNISFQYAVLGHLQPQKEIISVLEDSSIIHSEDEIRINVGYAKETNLNIIYKGSKGEFMLLYSGENEPIESLPDTVYATPLFWSEFNDPTGLETFYFINSNIVLNELLSLLNRYDKVPAKGKIKLAKRIQSEIDALDPENKQDLASMDSRLANPVLGGVSFRGDEEGIKGLSLTHTCAGKYGVAFKKIVLNHQ